MLHYTSLNRLSSEKHSSLLGAFVSFKQNEVLWIRPKVFHVVREILKLTVDKALLLLELS